jgi:hypothetical protein
MKDAIGTYLSLRDTSTAFLEQVGQDAGVNDWDLVHRVGDGEVRDQSVSAAAKTPRFNEATDAKAPHSRGFARRDLRRAEEEHQVVVESAKSQADGRDNGAKAKDHQRNPFVAWLHRDLCLPSVYALAPMLPW